jgi:hypothetical protein
MVGIVVLSSLACHVCLRVERDLHNLSELQLVEDCGLSSSVKSNHQNSHLFLSPELIEQLRECETHAGGSE